MQRLAQIINDNEDWLMARILGYAKQHGYTVYTSTLLEAWRLSISGLSESILNALAHYPDIPELLPDEDYTQDPVAKFGINEAQRHRERGVSLSMFLGLTKYYRQSYLDLLNHQGLGPTEAERYGLFVNRVFDRIEIGFCTEWAGGEPELTIQELQVSNRLMTNEKNKYLTIFESIPIPVILINVANEIEGLNLAATKLFDEMTVAGGQYYFRSDNEDSNNDHDPNRLKEDLRRLSGNDLTKLMPWLKEAVTRHRQEGADKFYMEKETDFFGENKFFGITITKNLDVSEKFQEAIIIIEDLTLLKNEQKVLVEREKLQAALETIGMLRHEINQPLQIIMGMSEILLFYPDNSDSPKDQLEEISSAAKRLSNVIKKLDKIDQYKTKHYLSDSSILDLDESAGANESPATAKPNLD
ncbi:MAG: hypothetical protein KQI62_11940 [Deltaproteobacteria bacterium]|nr:hypothetical protein [Deltaproteobacteria bacterium]